MDGTRHTLGWIAFGGYLVITAGLAWLGHRKTDSLAAYAVGRRDMGPWLVGITMGASLASTATFIINPGFVHTHGVAAFMHFGVAIGLGIALALALLSPGFRRRGVEGAALSLPHWIGDRFGSEGLRVFFGALSLLSLTFVVLIVGGVRIMLETTLGLAPLPALLLTIGFVFSYILVGGTYAHAYTNTLQGILMLIVAAVILAEAVPQLFEPALWETIRARDPALLAPVNPNSALFDGVFSVYVAGGVIGFAVVCQPHLLMKALYLERDRDVGRYVAVACGVTAVFFGLLLVGLAAHADVAPGQVPQDEVMATWLARHFEGAPFVLISVALVAAGMSTLDGLLVASSTIAGNDLFLPLARKTLLRDRDPDQQAKVAYRVGQATLVAMGVGAFLICLDPPRLLGIFGQVGVYGLFAAAVGPVVLGVIGLDGRRHLPLALISAATGAGVHFALYLGGFDPNPGVTATWGILAAAAATGISWASRRAIITPSARREARF